MMTKLITWKCVHKANATDEVAIAASITNNSLRRSNLSAKTPPTKDNSKRGIACKSPMIPSAMAECVRRYTCQATATICICVPVAEINCPQNKRAKLRLRKALHALTGFFIGTAGLVIGSSDSTSCEAVVSFCGSVFTQCSSSSSERYIKKYTTYCACLSERERRQRKKRSQERNNLA